MLNKIIDFSKSNFAVCITIATGLIYLLTYIYQLGYCCFFGIPIDFIDIQVSTVLSWSFAIILIFVLVGVHLETMFHLLNRFFEGDIRDIVIRILILTAMSNLLLYLLFHFNYKVYVLLGSLGLVYLIYILITYRKGTKNRKREFERIKSENPDFDNKAIQEIIRGNIASRNRQVRPTTVVERVSLLTIFFLLVFWALGYREASNITIFNKLTDRPNTVLIVKYGDNLICKNYSLKDSKLGDSITIIKFSYNKDIKLKKIELKK